MKIHESAEDYLEAILKLREEHGMVRSIDIVRELGFSKPSISVAMKNLRENGYIQMDDDNYITLLPPGEEIAQRIYSSAVNRRSRTGCADAPGGSPTGPFPSPLGPCTGTGCPHRKR